MDKLNAFCIDNVYYMAYTRGTLIKERLDYVGQNKTVSPTVWTRQLNGEGRTMSVELSDIYHDGTSLCCDAPVTLTGFCKECGENAEPFAEYDSEYEIDRAIEIQNWNETHL